VVADDGKFLYRLHFHIVSSHQSQALHMVLGLTDAEAPFAPESSTGGRAWGLAPCRGELMKAQNCCQRGRADAIMEETLYGCASGASVFVWIDMAQRRCHFSLNDGAPVDAGVELTPSVRPWVRMAIKGDAIELRACERRGSLPPALVQPHLSPAAAPSTDMIGAYAGVHDSLPTLASNPPAPAPPGNSISSSVSSLSVSSASRPPTKSPWSSINREQARALMPLNSTQLRKGAETKSWPPVAPGTLSDEPPCPPPPFGLQADCLDLTQWSSSAKYAQQHMLDFDDRVGDGFVDAGRGSPLRSVAEWRAEPMNIDAREILHVELNAPKLRECLETARLAIRHETSLRAKFKKLALLCDSELGGPAPIGVPALAEADVRAVKHELRSNVLPLHKLLERNGAGRHRALLFKVLCDELAREPEHAAMRCRLVRGSYGISQARGGHAWNVVLVDGTPYVCDVMYAAGKLYDETSDRARDYQRLESAALKSEASDVYSDVGSQASLLQHQTGGRLIRKAELQFLGKIGSGHFGVVQRALYRHDFVAVKQIHLDRLSVDEDDQKKVRDNFLSELQLVSSLRHRHLVEFYGAGDSDRGELFIITELMEKGSLADCLRTNPSEFRWARLGKKILLDAAKGMLFLHEFTPPLTHFDIKPHNILVSQDNVGKLCDFGLTKPMRQTVTAPAGMTTMYAAPEVLMGKGGSEKSDIFSFGVSVLEVYQGRAPSRASGFKVQADASIETLLCGDANTHSGCLCEDPQHRPTAYQVREHMRVQ